MDFEDSRDQAAFRAEARAWLEANAARRAESDELGGLVHEVAAEEDLAPAREWQARKAADRWAGITWPERHGGRGGTVIHQMIWQQEEARFVTPPDPFLVGIGLAGPTLMAHGTEEQRDRFLAPMLHGEEVWCQLFSEPGAGSDLAGLRTRAQRDGDDWIVSGQKVWSSGAHYSDWGILPARSDFSAPKHAGLTYFLVDMRAPGVEIRPIRQISGDAMFNEVFLENVRIPDAYRVGEVGEGWRVTRTTLAHERMTMASGAFEPLRFEDLLSLARRRRRNGGAATADPVVRQRLADFNVQLQGLRFTGYRTLTELERDGRPGPAGSIGKLVLSRVVQDSCAAALDLLASDGIADGEDGWDAGYWQQAFVEAPYLRIAGGTDEIQRNIIAERVLGLPPDPRVDVDVPFADLPTGARR
jgi:alkylation response protein AidB-like acyl-CoA dehydrogenase